jgi:hypothetical protein
MCNGMILNMHKFNYGYLFCQHRDLDVRLRDVRNCKDDNGRFRYRQMRLKHK